MLTKPVRLMPETLPVPELHLDGAPLTTVSGPVQALPLFCQ
jgi:hypothetical protein